MFNGLSSTTKGNLCLAFVVINWTLSGFLLQYIQDYYRCPSLICYVTMIIFQLFYASLFSSGEKGKEAWKDLKKQYKLAFIVFFPYIGSYVLSTASYGLTDVLSASVLLSLSSLFTLIIGAMYREEDITLFKIIAAFISSASIMVLYVRSYYNDVFDNTIYPFMGNMMAILSSLLFAIYISMLRRLAVNSNNSKLTLGLIGTYSTFLLWPVLIILHKIDIEPLSLPTAPIAILILFNMIFCSYLGNYVWMSSLSYASSFKVSIALSLITPLTTLISIIFYHEPPNSYRIHASLLMILSSLFINLSEFYPQYDKVFIETYYKSKETTGSQSYDNKETI